MVLRSPSRRTASCATLCRMVSGPNRFLRAAIEFSDVEGMYATDDATYQTHGEYHRGQMSRSFSIRASSTT